MLDNVTGLGRKETMIRKLDGARSNKRINVSRNDSEVREQKSQSMWNQALFKQDQLWAA